MPSIDYKLPPLGGLKLDFPSQLLSREYSPSLNGVWPFNGRLRRIPGKQQLSSVAMDTSGGVMGMVLWKKDDGSSYFVACSQDKAYQYNATSGLFDSIHTGSDFSGGDADLFDFVPNFDSAGSEIIVITNGVDNIKKWTGTGRIADLGGSPDKAKYLENYENYLIKCGIANSPRTMQWTALGNAESHPVENFLDFFKSAGAILRPKALRSSLVIYKEDAISIVDFVGGDIVFRNRENYIEGHGLLASQSVLTYGYGAEVHYYIGSDYELHRFDLIEAPPISKGISQLLQNLDPVTRPYIVGVKTTAYDKLIWALPGRGQTGNRDLLVFDLKTGGFWVHEGEANRIFSACESTVGTGGLSWDTIPADTWDDWDVPAGWDALSVEGDVTVAFIAVGCADGKVRKMVAGVDDDGTALDSHYTYPFDNLDGNDQTEKILHKLIIEVENEGTGSITLEVFTNNNDQTAVILNDDGDRSVTLSLIASDANARFITHEIDVAVIGYNFSLKLASTGASWGGRLLKVIWQPIGVKIV